MTHLQRQTFCAIVGMLCLVRAAAAQTTFYVNGNCGDDSWTGLQAACESPNGPKETIQGALDSATSGDTVVVADGSYSGKGNTELQFGGKAIILRSANGREHCEIVGRGGGEVGGINFDSGEGPDAIVEGITFRYCWGRLGGGIRVSSMSTPTIRDCAFVECVAANGSGAGIGLDGPCGITIRNCYFRSNEGAGAAVAAWGAWVVIEDCDFSFNRASLTGAALYLNYGAEVTVSRCSFTHNRIEEDILSSSPDEGLRGAAVYLGENCTGTFVDCQFSRNEVVAYQVGRGAFGAGAYLAAGSVSTFLRCAFDGNRALGGGGGKGWESRGSAIRSSGASVEVIDCLIINNVTESGAVASVDGTVRIVNSTLVGNRGYKGVGGVESLNADDMVVVNSIVWDNTTPQVGGEPSIEFSCMQEGWIGQGNISDEPMFVDAENGDYRLAEFSPCIDAGDSESLVCTRAESIDLAGEPRYRDDKRVPDTGRGTGALADMGAYEAAGLAGLRVACVEPRQSGEVNSIAVSQARPGKVIYFAYGFQEGLTPVPRCRPAHVLIDQSRLLGHAVADAAGNAVLSVHIPAGLAGRTIRIQAVEPFTCRVSNLGVVTIAP